MIVRQLKAIFVDTVREASSRWMFAGMALSGAVSAGLLFWYIQTITVRTPHSTLTALTQADPRFLDQAFLARHVLAGTASMAIWTQVAFAVALLSGMIAPLLSTERNALIIAAPVGRPLLLIGRYLGFLAIVLWGISTTFGLVWTAASWKFGLWYWPFLAGIGTTLVVVSGITAMLLLCQVAVNSPAVSMVLITALSLLAAGGQMPDRVRDMTGSAVMAEVAVFVGRILPRSSEIANLTAVYVNSGSFHSIAPLWWTAAGSVVFLAFAAMLFHRREF